MDDDAELLEMDCPKCGSYECYSQPCTDFRCDDGMIDDHDEDPVNSPMGSFYTCPTCHGCGHHHWCSKCGYNITAADFEADRKASAGDDDDGPHYGMNEEFDDAEQHYDAEENANGETPEQERFQSGK